MPYFLRAGILPPLLLASVVYVLAVILTMGIIRSTISSSKCPTATSTRPGFLELPPTPAPPTPVLEKSKPDLRVRSISLDESR